MLAAMLAVTGMSQEEAPYFTGIFQENPFITHNLEYGEDLSFTIWNGFTNASDLDEPYAGDTSLYLVHTDGTWNAVGVTSQNPMDFGNYLNGYLHFAMKIEPEIQDTFRVGIKTQGGKEYAAWYYGGESGDPYDFARDGEWHEVMMPILEMVERVSGEPGTAHPTLADLQDLRNPFIWNGENVTVALDEIWWAEGSSEPSTVWEESLVRHFELGFGATLPVGWTSDGVYMTTTESNRNTTYEGTFGGTHAVKILKPCTITTKGYYTAGTLSFWLMSKQEGVDSLVVEKSNDGGDTWTNVITVVSDGVFDYTQYTVDINDDSPSVKLRFSSGDAKEFYMDDLYLTTTQPLSDDNAYLLELHVDGLPLPGFESGALQYEHTLTYPQVTLDAVTFHPGATYEINLPEPDEFFGSDAERTGTVVVTSKDGTQTQTYEILFHVDGYHIRYGFPQSGGGAIPPDWSSSGTYTASGVSNDLYPGGNAMRFTTLDGSLVTKPYQGVDTVMFYTKVEMNDGSPIQAGEMLTMSTWGPGDTEWTEIGSFTTDTEINADWQQKMFALDDDRDSVQIMWQVTSTNAATRIYLDDIAITGHPKYLDPGYYTGFEQKESPRHEINVYPNPAVDHLYVRLPENISSTQLIMINLQGQQVKNIRLDQNNNMISLNNLKSGLYIIQLISGKLVYTEKIMIK